MAYEILNLIMGYTRQSCIIVMGGMAHSSRYGRDVNEKSEAVFVLATDPPVDDSIPWQWHSLPPLPHQSYLGWAG
jgi:hypothetical protein